MNPMFLLDVSEPSGTGGLSLAASLLVVLLVLVFTSLSLGTLLFILWRRRRVEKDSQAQS